MARAVGSRILPACGVRRSLPPGPECKPCVPGADAHPILLLSNVPLTIACT